MRIGIMGHFGGNEVFHDGQTVKTVTIYDALVRKCPGIQIDKVDTYYIKRNPVKFCFQFLNSAFFDKKIVVLLSKNGRKILFPVLYVLSKVFRREIYHDSIGGQLADEAESNAKWKKYISSFQANWVESKDIAQELIDLGVSNAVYLPNFKSLKILSENDLKTEYQEPFCFATFSRVMPEKGIEDAIRAIASINQAAGRMIARLDIFGPIETGYEERFYQCLKEAGEDCRYGGVIPTNDSVEILKDYFALLFPTYWKGEGMPGTVVDAYSAGLPMIARRWPFCDELIKQGVTGYVYDFDRPEELPNVIMYAIEHPDAVMQMKANCLKAASQYSEQHVMKQIAEQMHIEIGLYD